jgi:ribosomal protein S18 acetylase RimI-like enzyme
MDAGWTRWVLERYGFEFLDVSGSDIEAGALRGRVDVLIVTDEPRGILGPTGSAGSAASTGAAGLVDNAARLVKLDEFVRGGGTLVCLNRSSLFAIEQLKLPVKNVLTGLGRQEFFAGGSLLRVTVDPGHPVMAGMPVDAAVFVQGSPAFEPLDGFRGTVLARYGEAASPLLSGYLLGEKHLLGKAAALDVEHGDGHIVLIGFRPQWRGQPFGTFRVLFNAALYRRN